MVLMVALEHDASRSADKKAEAAALYDDPCCIMDPVLAYACPVAEVSGAWGSRVRELAGSEVEATSSIPDGPIDRITVLTRRGADCAVEVFVEASVSGIQRSRSDFDVCVEPLLKVHGRRTSSCGYLRGHGAVVVKHRPPRSPDSSQDLAFFPDVDVVKAYRELAMLRCLAGHSNIARVVGCCLDEVERPLVLLDVRPDHSLEAIVAKYKKLGWRVDHGLRLRYARDVAMAVEHCHAHRPPLIHRDLRPANLALHPASGALQLFDFEKCRIFPSNDLRVAHSMTDAVGSYRYSAPEQSRGHPYSAQVDVYSWAMVCTLMLRNKAPYAGLSEDKIAFAHFFTHTRPEPLPKDEEDEGDGKDSSLANLVRAAWNEDASKRPLATDLVLDLDALIAKHDAAPNSAPRKSPLAVSTDPEASSSQGSFPESSDRSSICTIS